ncbi:MAG: undecaprenyl-phosphate glucose phosphotransferase [Acidobacteriota bacterium]|nr:undecaprenyl-phosphate glucose phosphotransferase [Acidobacteriota bacterium]
MLKRHNQLLIACHVIGDAVLSMAAFSLAYFIRFYGPLEAVVPVTKGYPPFTQYLMLMPFIGLLVPAAFQLQGVYRLRRGRSRVDEFFSVFVGSIVAVVIGIGGTLYVQTYYLSEIAKDRGLLEISQPVWALFLVLNVLLTYLLRAAVRTFLETRFRNGIGLKRVLIAGAGDLARVVADKILEHSELGFRVVGFVDDKSTGDHIGYRGLPILGTLGETPDVCKQENIDQIYVALPLDEHVKMLGLIEYASREFIDVHVVPDLLEFLTLRARLEDLDGVPIISIHEVPLRGINAVIKRVIDIALSASVLLLLSIPFALIALLIKKSSPGPAFYRQERMGLDGKAFHVWKFRSMPINAEDASGPIWARDDDPRATSVGRWLRKLDLDEMPQFWNVLMGDMSIVGPRPERPFFVEQFKHRIPSYMLRHKVKAGITGWAQVNGWRGNTSLEKRIEYDLYYIENWSVGLDIKIMWMTIFRGFQKVA